MSMQENEPPSKNYHTISGRFFLTNTFISRHFPFLLPFTPQSPITSDRDAYWRNYWRAHRYLPPIPAEPEIDYERRLYLTKRRASIEPNVEQNIYPFKDFRLSRADITWLLEASQNEYRVADWNYDRQREGLKLDLRGADLRHVDLRGLPMYRVLWGLTPDEDSHATAEQRDQAAAHLEGAILREVHLEGAYLTGTHLEGAELSSVHLEGANLHRAHLEGVNLYRANLQGANLSRAHLEGANLYRANLQEVNLSRAHLEGANLRAADLKGAYLFKAHLEGKEVAPNDLERIEQWEMDFPMTLPPVDLQLAFFDNVTRFNSATLGEEKFGFVSLADVSWGGVNLTVVDWASVKMLGDEQKTHLQTTSDGKVKDRSTRIEEYRTAVRANRQLTVVLRDQGLNEEADRFAYRGQLLQRKVLRLQRKFGRWLFSMLLALLSGYGYRIWRILAAYVIVVSLFALAYFVLGLHYPPHLPFVQAFLESITAFHGRVFLEQFSPTTPQIWFTALEAIAGLVIEGVFIAMLIQRFFGK